MNLKFIVVLFLLVLCFSNVNAADVRNVNWGMNRDEVIEAHRGFEGGLVRDLVGGVGDSLIGMVEVLDVSLEIMYYFTEFGLNRITYGNLTNSIPRWEEERLFDKIKDILEEKYGDSKSVFAPQYSSFGKAFEWKSLRTSTVLRLPKEKFGFGIDRLSLTLDYYCLIKLDKKMEIDESEKEKF